MFHKSALLSLIKLLSATKNHPNAKKIKSNVTNIKSFVIELYLKTEQPHLSVI